MSQNQSLERMHLGRPISEECKNVTNGYPTAKDFYSGLGAPYASALYVCSALVVFVLAIQFGILVRHFFKYVPSSRRVPTLWVNSVYLVVAISTLFCVVLPQSSDFVWLFYRVYLGMALGYFVDLTLAWYGGEGEMLRLVGEGREVNFRVRPCCCCFCLCRKNTPFSKQKIHNLRGAVYQMPYIQGISVFLVVVFELTGYLEIGDLDPAKPYLYLMIVISISFFLGLWALFVLLSITHEYELLTHFKYPQKAGLLKAIVIFVNMQGFVLDSLGNYNIIECIPPKISSMALVSTIKSILTLFESFVLGSFAFRLYVLDNTHL